MKKTVNLKFIERIFQALFRVGARNTTSGYMCLIMETIRKSYREQYSLFDQMKFILDEKNNMINIVFGKTEYPEAEIIDSIKIFIDKIYRPKGVENKEFIEELKIELDNDDRSYLELLRILK